MTVNATEVLTKIFELFKKKLHRSKTNNEQNGINDIWILKIDQVWFWLCHTEASCCRLFSFDYVSVSHSQAAFRNEMSWGAHQLTKSVIADKTLHVLHLPLGGSHNISKEASAGGITQKSALTMWLT